MSDAAQALVIVHVCTWQDQAFGAAMWLQHPALLGLPWAPWEAGGLKQADVSPCGRGAVVREGAVGAHAGVLCAAVRVVIHLSLSGQVGFRKGLTAPVSPDVSLKDCLSGRFLLLGHSFGTGALNTGLSEIQRT